MKDGTYDWVWSWKNEKDNHHKVILLFYSHILLGKQLFTEKEGENPI